MREGVSIQLDCSAPGLMVVNSEAMGSSSFQTASVTRDQAGFYQCLTEDSVDSVYLLVTCKSGNLLSVLRVQCACVTPFPFPYMTRMQGFKPLLPSNIDATNAVKYMSSLSRKL